MTLEVKPETARRLLSLAKRSGVSVDELLQNTVPGLSDVELSSEDGKKRAKAFRDWAAKHPTDTPPLSDDAISRRSIYEP